MVAMINCKKAITFNINHYVHVKLTEVGRKELERQHKELFAEIMVERQYVPPKADVDGWSKWQLHDLMARFGHMMYNGFECPFETEIRFEVQDDTVMMPKNLTAENGAKAAMMGEFFVETDETCGECYGNGCGACYGLGYQEKDIAISWTTIKDIYKKAVELFSK